MTGSEGCSTSRARAALCRTSVSCTPLQLTRIEAPQSRIPGNLSRLARSSYETPYLMLVPLELVCQRPANQATASAYNYVHNIPLRSAPAWLMMFLVSASAGCAAQQSSSQPASGCRVSLVSDGDSLRCQDGRRVRLIGVDAPEALQRPYGGRSRAALQRLVPLGTDIRLESDLRPTDQYRRQLAYVWVGPSLVNEVMVRDGWAVLYTVPPNVKYAARLERAQREARARGAGLWAEQGFECLPTDFRQKRCVSRP
jgi:micrococcal nuclease